MKCTSQNCKISQLREKIINIFGSTDVCKQLFLLLNLKNKKISGLNAMPKIEDRLKKKSVIGFVIYFNTLVFVFYFNLFSSMVCQLFQSDDEV